MQQFEQKPYQSELWVTYLGNLPVIDWIQCSSWGVGVGVVSFFLNLHNHWALLAHHYVIVAYLIPTRFWVVVICPIIKCLTVLEFSFILFDLCLFITIFNFILNYVPIVTFWIFTYHKIWILLIILIIELFIF